MSWSQGLVPSFILSWNVCCTAVVVFFSMVWRWFFKMEGLQTAAGDGRKLLEWNLGSWKRDKGDLCRKAWPHWPGYSSSSGQCSSVLLDGDGEHKMWAGWQLGLSVWEGPYFPRRSWIGYCSLWRLGNHKRMLLPFILLTVWIQLQLLNVTAPSTKCFQFWSSKLK